jgi:ParB-like chromosome segregation protein Spo0J
MSASPKTNKKPRAPKQITIMPEEIYIDGPRRPIVEATVARLVESIGKLGLLNPPTVRIVNNLNDPIDGELDSAYVLVAGRHRVEACKRLGIEQIECSLVDVDATGARMMEIAENLDRAELTALERDEHVAEWIRLADLQSRQPDANEKSKREDGRGHRHEGGVRAASRELGLSEPDARRANQVAGLSDEAKAVAKESGFDDNRSVLLKAAKATDDVAFLRAEHDRREAEMNRKEAEKLNRDTNGVIALTVADEFAEWIMGRTDLHELPTIISWIQGSKQKDVIAALRKRAA